MLSPYAQAVENLPPHHSFEEEYALFKTLIQKMGFPQNAYAMSLYQVIAVPLHDGDNIGLYDTKIIVENPHPKTHLGKIHLSTIFDADDVLIGILDHTKDAYITPPRLLGYTCQPDNRYLVPFHDSPSVVHQLKARAAFTPKDIHS